MPYYALVVDDPEKHHAAAVERQARAHLPLELRKAHGEARAARKALSPVDEVMVATRVHRQARQQVGDPRLEGDLHTAMSDECPDGLPNCRNCGDPAHAASCKAKGHCPHCGTRHGIAPASYLALSGVVLQEVVVPDDEPGVVAPAPEHRDRVIRRFVESHIWDRQSRQFVPRG